MTVQPSVPNRKWVVTAWSDLPSTSNPVAIGRAVKPMVEGEVPLRTVVFCRVPFSGRWRREGTEVVVYGIDEVSNGDMSMLIFRLDARGNDVSVTHYALD